MPRLRRGVIYLKFILNDIRQHVSPGRPVMIYIRPPDIKVVANAFIPQYLRKTPVGIRVFKRTTAGVKMNMVAGAYLIQVPVISKVWNIVYRAVVIHLFIPKALCIFCEIVYAAHTDCTVDKIRLFEK